MKPRLVLLSTVAVAAVLCQLRPCQAVQYLSIHRSQDIAAFARDYVGDPISTLDQRELINSPVGFLPVWPTGRLLYGASVARINARASSISQIDFEIDPFGLDSGYVAIFQTVQTESCCGSEAYARVGAAGEALTIEFLIDDLEGNVELSVQGAWKNSGVWGNLSLFQGGYGFVTVDNVPLVSEGVASKQLAPGVHTLTVGKYGFDGGPYTASSTTFGHMIANWTFDGVYTGETASRPHVMVVAQTPDGDDPFQSLLAPLAAVQLTFPVVGNTGLTDDTFVGLPTAVINGISKGALVTGFEVISEFAPFTSFTVPELPAGGSSLSIDYGSGPQGITAGQTIDFGPSGISSFLLTGFDPTFASEERDAFVMGLRFAAEGVASILAHPVLYQPPGDFDENGFVDGNDFLLWQQQSGTLVDPGTGIDVVADGVVDGQDLAVWYGHFGEPAASAPLGQPVPEPCMLTLIACAAAGFSRRLRRPQG